jgi:hypothetical protein
LNKQEAIAATKGNYQEEKIVVWNANSWSATFVLKVVKCSEKEVAILGGLTPNSIKDLRFQDIRKLGIFSLIKSAKISEYH